MRRVSDWAKLGAFGLVAACGQFGGFELASDPNALEWTDDSAPTVASQELAVYYARVESGHRTRGLLRADGGGPDAPFDADRLARTFEDITFSREFSDVGSALIRRSDASILHRWAAPVQIEPVFGPAVDDLQRADDTAAIERYAARLGRVTGHPISKVERAGNFRVLIVTEDQRRTIGPTLKRMLPEIRQREIDLIQNLERATYCVVVASDPKNDGVLTRAVAIVRAELPPLLRLSCIHEELAQGLGLSDDSPRARPSIFNDDDEFGRLTTMDELMLRMLYDPKLAPGMDADAARPIVKDLAQGLTAPAM